MENFPIKNHTVVWPSAMHGLRQIFKNDLLLWILRKFTTSCGKLHIPSKKDHRPIFGYGIAFLSICLIGFCVCVWFFFFVKVYWLDYYLIKLATVKFAVNDFDKELEIIYLILSVNSLLTNSMLYPFPSFIDWWQIYMPQAGAKALR